MGKGSFDEKRSMRKRLYRRERGAVKARDRGEGTSLDEKARSPLKKETEYDLFDKVKRNSWEPRKIFSYVPVRA
jgi:hypothetical protein